MRFYKLLVILIMATLANFANAKETKGAVIGYSLARCSNVSLTQEQRSIVFGNKDAAHGLCIQLLGDLGAGYSYVRVSWRNSEVLDTERQHEYKKGTLSAYRRSLIMNAYPVCKTDFETPSVTVDAGEDDLDLDPDHPSSFMRTYSVNKDQSGRPFRKPVWDRCLNNCRVVCTDSNEKSFVRNNFGGFSLDNMTNDYYEFYNKCTVYNEVCFDELPGDGVSSPKEKPEESTPPQSPDKAPKGPADCKPGQAFGYVNDRPTCVSGGTGTGSNGSCERNQSGTTDSEGNVSCKNSCPTGSNYAVKNGKEQCTDGAGNVTGPNGAPSPTDLPNRPPLYGKDLSASPVCGSEGCYGGDSGSGGTGGSGSSTSATGTGTGASGATGATSGTGTGASGATGATSGTGGTGTGASGATDAGEGENPCQDSTKCGPSGDGTYGTGDASNGIKGQGDALKGSFSNLLNFRPTVQGTCYKPVFSVFGDSFTMDSHCDLFDEHGGTLSIAAVLCWVILSIFVILRA